jgi:hypothetical protein
LLQRVLHLAEWSLFATARLPPSHHRIIRPPNFTTCNCERNTTDTDNMQEIYARFVLSASPSIGWLKEPFYYRPKAREKGRG